MACLFYHMGLATMFVAILVPSTFAIPVLIGGGVIALLLDVAISKRAE